jgi:hypothetical protein
MVLALGACLTGGDSGDADTFRPPPPARLKLTAVTPVDAYHVRVTFNNLLSRDYAESDGNYSVLQAAAPSPAAREGSRAPDDPIEIIAARLDGVGTTVTLSTASSMMVGNHTLIVMQMHDLNGDRLPAPVSTPFVASSAVDDVPPQIIFTNPSPGVAISRTQPIILKFSEGVTIKSINSAISWMSDQGLVSATVSEANTSYQVVPSQTLPSNSAVTLRLSGIKDPAGNTMPDTEWTYQTQDF